MPMAKSLISNSGESILSRNSLMKYWKVCTARRRCSGVFTFDSFNALATYHHRKKTEIYADQKRCSLPREEMYRRHVEQSSSHRSYRGRSMREDNARYPDNHRRGTPWREWNVERIVRGRLQETGQCQGWVIHSFTFDQCVAIEIGLILCLYCARRIDVDTFQIRFTTNLFFSNAFLVFFTFSSDQRRLLHWFDHEKQFSSDSHAAEGTLPGVADGRKLTR